MCVSSDGLPEWRHGHTGYISLVFEQLAVQSVPAQKGWRSVQTRKWPLTVALYYIAVDLKHVCREMVCLSGYMATVQSVPSQKGGKVCRHLNDL